MRELLVVSDEARYFEPFFGGGAHFFALLPAKATISDRNVDLMDCYRAIRDDPRAVERSLRGLPVGADAYYEVRKASPTTPHERAARFVYLTTHSFNGIYRVNREGVFNVPYGYREYSLGEHLSLEAHSKALASAEILSGDFATAVEAARAGDVVYLDPPYTVTHSRNGFLKYNARVFSWPDQERLAHTASNLAERGCRVVISNAEHETIAALYGAFRAILVPRFSRMASDATRRRKIVELIYTNAPEAPASGRAT